LYSHDPRVTKCEEIPVEFPLQYQPGQPGLEFLMVPRPVSEQPGMAGPGKLQNKVAIITGGDGGIGRAVAYLFARELIRVPLLRTKAIRQWLVTPPRRVPLAL